MKSELKVEKTLRFYELQHFFFKHEIQFHSIFIYKYNQYVLVFLIQEKLCCIMLYCVVLRCVVLYCVMLF